MTTKIKKKKKESSNIVKVVSRPNVSLWFQAIETVTTKIKIESRMELRNENYTHLFHLMA